MEQTTTDLSQLGKTILNVHNLSLARYLNRIGYPYVDGGTGPGVTHAVVLTCS